MNTISKAFPPRFRSLFAPFLRALVVCGIFLSTSQAAFACTGADYDRTMQVLNYSMQAGYEFGMTGNYNLFTQRLQEIVQAIQQLPPSCQALLQQMNSGFSSGGSGTTCMGGVCCDSTGCY